MWRSSRTPSKMGGLDRDLRPQRRERQAAPVDAATGRLGRRGDEQVAGLRIDGNLQCKGLVGEGLPGAGQPAIGQHRGGVVLGVITEGAGRGRVVLVGPLAGVRLFPPRPLEEFLGRLAFDRRVLRSQSARQVRQYGGEAGHAVEVLLVCELVMETCQHAVADFGPIAVGLDDRAALARGHPLVRHGRTAPRNHRAQHRHRQQQFPSHCRSSSWLSFLVVAKG